MAPTAGGVAGRLRAVTLPALTTADTAAMAAVSAADTRDARGIEAEVAARDRSFWTVVLGWIWRSGRADSNNDSNSSGQRLLQAHGDIAPLLDSGTALSLLRLKRKIGQLVSRTPLDRPARRATARYSRKVQQRPPTATSMSYRPNPALAGTAAKRPEPPLVRDEKARTVVAARAFTTYGLPPIRSVTMPLSMPCRSANSRSCSRSNSSGRTRNASSASCGGTFEPVRHVAGAATNSCWDLA